MTSAIASFVAYSAYSGLLLLCLYLVYKLFLSNQTFYTFNRAYLLASYGVAFGYLPARWLASKIVVVPTPGVAGAASSSGAFFSLPSGVGAAIAGVYLAGVVAMTAFNALSLLKISRIWNAGRSVGDDLWIIADSAIVPFSWGGRIFISEADYAANGEAIVAHESKHRACRHWIDLAVAQLAIIANWFNPAAWLMARELKNVHEYQADATVADAGIDMRRYQLMLIQKSTGKKFSSIANCLSQGAMRKRIDMMLRKPSCGGRRLCSLLAVPAIVCITLAVNYNAIAASVQQQPLPTIYVNGMEVGFDDMNDIDKDAIESITVMKNGNRGQIYIKLKDK